MYPTEKQDKYIRDIVYAIKHNINFIGGKSTSNIRVVAKKPYLDIYTHEEIANLIDDALRLECFIGKYAQSAQQKTYRVILSFSYISNL